MAGTNFLSSVEFRFTIKRLPNVEFFIQGANLPGINSGYNTQPTPFKNVYLHGDKLEYEDLVLTCIVDEQMQSYIETWNWLEALTKPKSFDQYRGIKESEDGLYSDATLTILNSSKNAKIEITFQDLFPVSVSGIDLDTKQTDLTPPTVQLTFRYNSYSIKVLS